LLGTAEHCWALLGTDWAPTDDTTCRRGAVTERAAFEPNRQAPAASCSVQLSSPRTVGEKRKAMRFVPLLWKAKSTTRMAMDTPMMVSEHVCVRKCVCACVRVWCGVMEHVCRTKGSDVRPRSPCVMFSSATCSPWTAEVTEMALRREGIRAGSCGR
jgi:hypothetical protein